MVNTPFGPSPSGKYYTPIVLPEFITIGVSLIRSLKLLSRTTKLVEESLTVDLS